MSTIATPLSSLKENFLGFPFRVLGSPFKGFDELKFQKKGSYAFSFFVLILAALLPVLEFVYNGFLINTGNPYMFNSLFLALSTLFPALLFVTANWSITTLLEGKGRYGEIFQVLAYSLFPMCLLRIIALVLSRVLTLEEIALIGALKTVGAVIFFFYLFIGLVVIHEYTFFKALGALLLTVVSMMVITFILMLFLALVADVTSFVTVFTKEIIFKYF